MDILKISVVLKHESKSNPIGMHSTMYSNARSDGAIHNLNISSIEPPATSGNLEEISSASLNFSEEKIEQQNGPIDKNLPVNTEKSNVQVIKYAGPSKAHVTTQPVVHVIGVAGASVMHISAGNKPSDNRDRDNDNAGPSTAQTIAVIAGTSNYQTAIVTESFQAQTTGSSDIAGISVFSSDAPDLSANMQELMELVYEDVCDEEEKNRKIKRFG